MIVDPPEAIALGAPRRAQDPDGRRRECQLCESPVADERQWCVSCSRRGQGSLDAPTDGGSR